MPGPRFVDGDPVSLHVVAADDLSFYQRGWTEPELRRPMSIERPLNREATESFLEEVDEGDGATFLACVDGERRDSAAGSAAATDSATPVGTASLFGIDADSGVGSIAYWIAPESQGEDYGIATVESLLDYAFFERRLHRLRADVLADNDASRGLLERLGFEREGTLRGQSCREGERLDCDVFGLLEDEWRTNRPSGRDDAARGGAC